MYDIKFYGKAAYDLEEEVWKRITPIEVPFNEKICQLDFNIEDARPMYTQIKYNLDDFGSTATAGVCCNDTGVWGRLGLA